MDVGVPHGEVPPYLRVADALRQRILSGGYAPGERIPSRAELAAEHGVATKTITEAIRVLIAEGLVEGRSGSGTYVRERPRLQRAVRSWYREQRGGSPFAADTRAQGRRPDWTSSTQFRVPAPAAIAERLGIACAAPVVRTDYLFAADGEPVMLSTSWEPYALTAGTPVLAPEDGPLGGRGVRERMASIGVHITHGVEIVGTRPPTRDEARQLRMPTGAALVTIERTYYAEDDPVETADIRYPGDRYQVVYEIPVDGQR